MEAMEALKRMLGSDSRYEFEHVEWMNHANLLMTARSNRTSEPVQRSSIRKDKSYAENNEKRRKLDDKYRQLAEKEYDKEGIIGEFMSVLQQQLRTQSTKCRILRRRTFKGVNEEDNKKLEEIEKLIRTQEEKVNDLEGDDCVRKFLNLPLKLSPFDLSALHNVEPKVDFLEDEYVYMEGGIDHQEGIHLSKNYKYL